MKKDEKEFQDLKQKFESDLEEMNQFFQNQLDDSAQRLKNNLEVFKKVLRGEVDEYKMSLLLKAKEGFEKFKEEVYAEYEEEVEQINKFKEEGYPEFVIENLEKSSRSKLQRLINSFIKHKLKT